MKMTLSFVFLAALLACGSFEETTTETSQQSTTGDITTLESTTASPTTTTTSFPSTSTILTSTEPATSTNPTSTIPPTTTSSTTSSTTISTSTMPITTTRSPEPPVPETGSWNVTEGNLTCIRVDLKARFKIFIQDRTEYIVLSPNATSNGNCNDTSDTQTIELIDQEYTFLMTFAKDATDSYLRNISFAYTLPGISGRVHNDTRLFSVKTGNSYLCSSTSNVVMENVTMEIFIIHLQSYGSTGSKGFGTAEECEADNKVNDIVPIAVGIALLSLVVVVLIAYFVGRRRSRQKGYQSV